LRVAAGYVHVPAMTVQQLQEIMRAQPFVPFRINYPGGSPVEVPHEDFIALSQTRRIATVALPDDRWIKIDVGLITSIEELHPSAR
jgi:hypothetical protein